MATSKLTYRIVVTAIAANMVAGSESGLWSLRPIQSPQPPTVRNTGWVRNPIDAFILARLEGEGIQPSSEADRYTLLRRLSLDLIGLPPSPEEIHDFVNNTSPDAYERVVDRLLVSPHYGEKWARYWLDLARYADSDGFRSDRFRPHAWRYRQWVIDALNADMPFDEFTMDQIAGDILPNATVDQRVATGFHRNTLTNREGGTDPEQFRFEQVVDRANTVGIVWLGLTVGCAQCHDHKYDPISQKDYYRLFAFFNNAEEVNIQAPLPGQWGPFLGAKTEYDRKRAEFLENAGVPELQAAWEKRLLEAAAQPGKWLDWDHAFDDVRTDLEWGERTLRTPREKRTESETKALTDYFLRNYQRVITKERAEELNFGALSKQLAALDAALPEVAIAPVLAPARKTRKNSIYVRGDYRNPGIEVQPGFLSALRIPDSRELTRVDLARFLTSPENPLTARVMVNRIWQEFFGRGLVRTSDNFGTQGEVPSHPELLDWLATDFAQHGWRVKRMQRQIVLSSAYRQSSARRAELAEKDPDNALIARQSRYRLPAELIRDSALSASGLLNPAIGGKSIRPPRHEGSSGFSSTAKSEWKVSSGAEQYRRGMYIQLHRTAPYALLLNFDAPAGYGATCRRGRSNTPLQALNLLNDPVFTEAARAMAFRLLNGDARNFTDRLSMAFLFALGRTPSGAESEDLLAYFESQKQLLAKSHSSVSALYPKELARNADETEGAAWVAVSSVILNTDEFLSRE